MSVWATVNKIYSYLAGTVVGTQPGQANIDQEFNNVYASINAAGQAVDVAKVDLGGAGRTTETIKGVRDELETHKGDASAHGAIFYTKAQVDAKDADLAGTGRTTETIVGAYAALQAHNNDETAHHSVYYTKSEVDVKIPADVTGAYNRNNGVFNVKDSVFGAKGDGVTDDSPAIQSAVDAAEAVGGGLVFIPTGTYIVNTGITVENKNVILRGNGKGAVLKAGASVTVVTVNPGPSNMNGNAVEQLSIDLNGLSGAIGVTFATGGQRMVGRDIWVDNIGANGYAVTTGFHTAINNLLLENIRAKSVGGLAANGFLLQCDHITAIGCDFAGGTDGNESTGYGFVIGNSSSSMSNVTLTGCEAAHCAQGIRVPAAIVYSLTLINPRIEKTTDYAISVVGLDSTNRMYGLSVINPYITRCAKGVFLHRIKAFDIRGGVYNNMASNPIEFGTPCENGQVVAGVSIGTTPASFVGYGANQNGLVIWYADGKPHWPNGQTATTATAGSATLPSSPQGFLVMEYNSTTIKVPYYPV